MKKILVVILTVGLIVSMSGYAWAQSDFDYKKINLLRWMDPYRNPITYQEYKESRHFATEFNARCIYSSSKGDTPICIVINNLLQSLIQSSFSVFLEDLEYEGYTPHVYTAINNGDETALKDILISEWNSHNIVGAILIGDLPIAWYEMTEPPDWVGHTWNFPLTFSLWT